MNVILKYRAQSDYRQLWDGFMGKICTKFSGDWSSANEWLGAPGEKTLSIWERLECPLFLSLALQKSQDRNDLIREVISLRNQAMDIRGLFRDYVLAAKKNEPTVGLVKEISSLTEAIDSEKRLAPNSIAVSVGIPCSLSFGIEVPGFGSSNNVSFIRDLYRNYGLPYMLCEDIKRVFNVNRLQSMAERELVWKGNDTLVDAAIASGQ